jgi:hypothetical protein
MPNFIVTLEKRVTQRAYVRVNAASEVGARTKARTMTDAITYDGAEWHAVYESDVSVHETEALAETKGGEREPVDAVVSE